MTTSAKQVVSIILKSLFILVSILFPLVIPSQAQLKSDLSELFNVYSEFKKISSIDFEKNKLEKYSAILDSNSNPDIKEIKRLLNKRSRSKKEFYQLYKTLSFLEDFNKERELPILHFDHKGYRKYVIKNHLVLKNKIRKLLEEERILPDIIKLQKQYTFINNSILDFQNSLDGTEPEEIINKVKEIQERSRITIEPLLFQYALTLNSKIFQTTDDDYYKLQRSAWKYLEESIELIPEFCT